MLSKLLGFSRSDLFQYQQRVVVPLTHVDPLEEQRLGNVGKVQQKKTKTLSVTVLSPWKL